MLDMMEQVVGTVNSFVWGWPMIILLFGTHIFLTFRTGFIQKKIWTGIKLSVAKEGDAEGDVSPFGALSTALASTIGTGNIIGVGTAIAMGGPGAVLWCWLTGVFGIATKYSESLIAVKYRVKTEDGRIQGGAMYALEKGLNMKWLGVLFAFFASFASIGTGCATQVNAIATVCEENLHIAPEIVGVVVAIMTALVIFGGIRTIAAVCEKLVPFMAAFYVLGCVIILGMNYDFIIPAIKTICRLAFTPGAAAGGLVGGGIRIAIQYGVARGLFSNESGLGSAPIAAAAAQTKNPVRQALVSATGTFWDTVVVCLMTGLVLVTTIMKNPAINANEIPNGGVLTSLAFQQIPVVGPIILVVGMISFAYSTVLGWAYYGERCVEYLLGKKALIPYRVLYVAVAAIAPVVALNIVWLIADTLNALMAVPNLIAVLMLSGVVVKETKKYLNNLNEKDNTPIPVVKGKDMKSQTREENNPLGYEKESKLLINFAIPCIISMLVTALYNIVDQIFIGQGVGMLGNAATNIAFPFSTSSTAIALLLGIGGASYCSLELGAGNEDKASKSAGNAMILMAVFGITLSLIITAFANPLLKFFGATEEVLPYAEIYSRIIAIGLPFVIANTGISKLILADGSPRYSMMSMLVGAIVNTILDPIFIFVLDWGMAGAAWATITGQIISFSISFRYVFHFKTMKLTKESFQLEKSTCGNIFALGMSACFNQIAMTLVQIVMNNTLKHYGRLSVYGAEIPLACAGIITKVNMIFMSFMIGISQGTQPIVGFNYGAKKYNRVKKAYMLAVIAATSLACVAFFCFQTFPRQIIGVFGGGSEEYFAFAERYFRIFLFMTVLNGIQPVSANFFTSIGKSKLGIFMSLTRQILFLLPLIVIFPLFMGIDGVMFAGPIADAAAAIVCGIFLVREMKELTVKQAEIGN